MAIATDLATTSGAVALIYTHLFGSCSPRPGLGNAVKHFFLRFATNGFMPVGR